MGKGFFSGLISGLLCAGFVAALLSLFAPLPPVEVQAVVTEQVGAAAQEEQEQEEKEQAEEDAEAAKAEEEAEAEKAAEDAAQSSDAQDQTDAPSQADVAEQTDRDAQTSQQAATDTTPDTAVVVDEPAKLDEGETQSVVAEDATADEPQSGDNPGDNDAPVSVTDADIDRLQDAPGQSAAVNIQPQTNDVSSDVASPATIASPVAQAPEVPQAPTPEPDPVVAEPATLELVAPDINAQTSGGDVPLPGVVAVPDRGTDTNRGRDLITPDRNHQNALKPVAETVEDAPDTELDTGLDTTPNAKDTVTQRLPQITDVGDDDDADSVSGGEIAPQEQPSEGNAQPDQDSVVGATPSGVTENRLPTITPNEPTPEGVDGTGGDDTDQPDAAPITDETDDAAQDDPAAPIVPLDAYAMPFEAQTDLPKIAIVVIADDLGAKDRVLDLGLPASVALSTTLEGGKELAAQLRQAGREVFTIPDDMPQTAQAGDVQVALESYFTTYPDSLGLLDPLDRRLQGNRNLLDPVLDTLKLEGRAFLTYQQGLDTAKRAAKRKGVPSSLIYRVLDLEREGTPRIMRYLDRAGFEAGRQGQVVVLAHSYATTLSAIADWSAAQADRFEFVPVSNLLKSAAE